MATNRRPPRARFEARSPSELREHTAHEALIPRAPETEFAELKRSVAAEGRVRVPLVILPDGVVLCGRDRLRAARELGLREVPVEVREDLAGDPKGQVQLLLDDNLTRKHFSEALRVKLAAQLLEIEKERAKARQVEGARRGGGNKGRARRKGSGNISGSLAESRDVVARRLGISGRQLDKARKVVQAAEDGSAPVAALYVDETVTASLAHEAMTRLAKDAQGELVAAVKRAPAPERPALARRLLRAGLARKKPAGSGPLEEVIAALEEGVRAVCRLREANADVYFFADALSEDQRTRILIVASEIGKAVELLVNLREHAIARKGRTARNDNTIW
jgi:ParB-like chromosome segregation protein Spo0J